MKKILTVDIGGTEIKSAIYTIDGTGEQLLPSRKTIVSRTDNHILEQVKDIARRAKADYDISGVAIASAGVIHPIEGRVIYAGPTIPKYTGTRLKEEIEQTVELPCTVENDVNAAALGEYWQGSGRGSHSIICLTIGTGVGGAVVLEGKLWHGHSFTAGEVGYLPAANGKTLQEVASTTALLRHYQQLSGEQVDGKQFFKRVIDCDKHAVYAFKAFISALTAGLLPAIYLLAPETVIIGGGIAAQREILHKYLRSELSDQIQSYKFLPKNTLCAELGNRAGMFGALYHFRQQNS